MCAILDDLLYDLVDVLPIAINQPLPTCDLKDRSGWFHCSDLKGGSVKFDPAWCIERYLGIAKPQEFKPETALSLGLGTGIDRLFDAALQLCWGIVSTQADLRDEGLRLRGTPDFMFAPWGDALPGDVKSCGPQTFRRYWANPDWDVSKAYFYRQLQAYMMLSGADRSVLLVVNRAGCEMGDEALDCLDARWVYEDKKCQARIRTDVEYMLGRVNEIKARTEQEAAA